MTQSRGESGVNSLSLPTRPLTLLGDVVTLGDELLVRDGVRGLHTLLLHKQPGSEDSLVELLGLLAEAALRVGPDLTAGLSDGGADVLLLLLALPHKHRVALLRLPLLPHHGLVGGHVHAELLVVQVNVGGGSGGGGGGGVVHWGGWSSVPSLVQGVQLSGLPSVPPGLGGGGGEDQGGDQQDDGEEPHGGQHSLDWREVMSVSILNILQTVVRSSGHWLSGSSSADMQSVSSPSHPPLSSAENKQRNTF